MYYFQTGDVLDFNVWALSDMEWRIMTGGFSVNYVGLQSEYFQAVKETNQIVTEEAEDVKTLVKFPHRKIKDKVFTSRQTGGYSMHANGPVKFYRVARPGFRKDLSFFKTKKRSTLALFVSKRNSLMNFI